MIIVFAIVSLIHSLVFINFYLKWKKIKYYQPQSSRHRKVSIVIPIRNEEDTITHLINAINNQKSETIDFELVIVDDHSEDNSISKIEKIIKDIRFPVNIFSLPDHLKGKKAAVTTGVSHASNDMILCTDADCIPGIKWVKIMTSFYFENQMKMVSGPVRMTANNFLGRLQQVEFSGLIGFGAISLNNDNPGMCNGANMAFSKKAFEEVEGYKGNEHIASGDDEFLLQKIAEIYPRQVGFLKNQEAIVSTPAKLSILQLIQQRLRWAGKWRFHKSIFIKSSAIFSFLDFFLGMAMISMAFYKPVLIVLFFVRFMGEWIYLKATNHFFRLNTSWIYYPMLSIIYPFFVVILGIASIFGKYSWKGRRY